MNNTVVDLPNVAFAVSGILYDGWLGVMLPLAHFGETIPARLVSLV